MAKTEIKLIVNQKAKDTAFSVFDALEIKPNDAVNRFLLYVATHQALPFETKSTDNLIHSVDTAKNAISSVIDEKQENIKIVDGVAKKVEGGDILRKNDTPDLHLNKDGVDEANCALVSAKKELGKIDKITTKIGKKLSLVDDKAKGQKLTIEHVVESRIREFEVAKKWVEDIIQLNMYDPLRQQDASFWSEFDRCAKLMQEAEKKLNHAKSAEKELWAEDVVDLLELIKSTRESFKTMKVANAIK